MRVFAIILSLLVVTFLYFKGEKISSKEIEILKGTKELKLIKAIAKHNLADMRELLEENPNLVNSQRLRYKWTPLMWSVKREYYDGVKLLLENGANPNIKNDYNNTALLLSISVSTNKEYDFDRNINITQLLLENGANPNIAYCHPDENGTSYGPTCGTTPLIKAASRSLKKVKLLLEYKANLNHKNMDGETAASVAISMSMVDIAYYLIINKDAELYPIKYISLKGIPGGGVKTHYPIEFLRDWLFKLDSEQYKKKMEIVEHLKKQGIDYSKTEPHKLTIKRIQKLYPNTWVEYLKKY